MVTSLIFEDMRIRRPFENDDLSDSLEEVEETPFERAVTGAIQRYPIEVRAVGGWECPVLDYIRQREVMAEVLNVLARNVRDFSPECERVWVVVKNITVKTDHVAYKCRVHVNTNYGPGFFSYNLLVPGDPSC